MSTGYLLVHCIDVVVSCIIWWNLRRLHIKQLFVHKPCRLSSMRDSVAATECRGRLMRIHTCVKEKGGYFEYKL